MHLHPKEQAVSSFLVWQQTWQLLGGLRRPVLQIALFTVFLPAVGFGLFFGSWSEPVVQGIRELAQKTFSQGVAIDYQQFFALASDFIWTYCLAAFVFASLLLAAFFALIRLNLAYLGGETEPSAKRAFIEALRQLFPHGYIFLILLGLVRLEQLFFGPFLVLSLFALMAPVIMIADKQGPFSAFKKALLFRYALPARGGGFNTAAVLFTLSLIIFGVESLAQIICDFLVTADEPLGLPRTLWALTLPVGPLTLVYALAATLGLAMRVFLFTFATGFLVNLFVNVRAHILQRV